MARWLRVWCRRRSELLKDPHPALYHPMGEGEVVPASGQPRKPVVSRIRNRLFPGRKARADEESKQDGGADEWIRISSHDAVGGVGTLDDLLVNAFATFPEFLHAVSEVR